MELVGLCSNEIISQLLQHNLSLLLFSSQLSLIPPAGLLYHFGEGKPEFASLYIFILSSKYYRLAHIFLMFQVQLFELRNLLVFPLNNVYDWKTRKDFKNGILQWVIRHALRFLGKVPIFTRLFLSPYSCDKYVLLEVITTFNSIGGGLWGNGKSLWRNSLWT